MHSVFYDAAVPDEVRRGNLFQGQLYVYSPRPISIELCNLANELAREAFAPHEPCEAQHHLPVDQFARTLLLSQDSFIIRSANDYFLNFFGNWAVISAKPISTSLVCAHPQATIS